jgi:hypothetical protein
MNTKQSIQNYSSQNPIINAQSLKKIREIPNPEEPIGKTILKICHMIGVVGELLPTTIQVCDWVEGIRKYYHQYAPEELYLACELNHYGKLATKSEHYGKFSIDYLSSCLKAYDLKKQEAIKHEKTKYTPPAPTPTNQKQLGYHPGRAYYIELEKWVKTEGNIPLFWDWSKCYSFLLENGDLAQDFPKQRMEEIYDRFKSLGKAEATTGRFSATTIGKALDFDNLTKDDTVKHECRKFVVQEYLRKKFEIQK